MGKFIPKPEEEFSRMASEMSPKFAAWWRARGGHEAHANAIESALEAFNKSRREMTMLKAQYEHSKQVHSTAKKKLSKMITFMRQSAMRDANLTDADRLTLKIPKPKPTRAEQGLILVPVPPPLPPPMVVLVATESVTHAIKIVRSEAPERRGKPKMVRFIELCVAFTSISQQAPVDDRVYQHVGLFATTSRRVVLSHRWVGHQAHYRARWITGQGEMGPWSAPMTAMVAA